MLVLQVKANDDIKLIDSDLGVPESSLKDVERLMKNTGMNRIFLTALNPDSFHEYVIYTLYKMVDEYFKGMVAINESDWNSHGEYSFVDKIFDHTLKALGDGVDLSENKLILDKVVIIEDESEKNHEFRVRIHSAVAINQ